MHETHLTSVHVAAELRLSLKAICAATEIPDELWTRAGIEFYKDAADAVLKSLVE